MLHHHHRPTVRPTWRRRGLAALALSGAALGAVLAAPPTAGAVPAGTVAETIPLGASLGRFGFAPTAFAQGRVWIGTARGVVRVDARTGRRQGRPIRTSRGNPFRLIPDGRRLWVLDDHAVTRIDARRAVVTGRIPIPPGTSPQALAIRGRVAWILTVAVPGPQPRPALRAYRVDTLRPCPACASLRTSALPVNPGSIDLRGRDAFVSGFSQEADSRTGLFRIRGTRITGFLASALFPEVTADGAWTVVGTGVTHVDLRRMAYDGRTAHLPGRSIDDPVAGLGRIWVTASVFVDRGDRPPLRRDAVLAAIDPATGGLAGDPVPLPATPSAFAMTTGGGSVWITTSKGLVRVRPSAAPPPPVVPAAPGEPAPILDGPLPAGRVAAEPPFGIGLTLSLADGGWMALPTGAPGAPATEALDIVRADTSTQVVNIILPVAAYGKAGRVPAASVEDAVAAIRANPRVRVSGVRAATVAGRPATRLVVRVVPRGVPIPFLGLSAPGDVFQLVRSARPDEVLLTTTAAGRLVAVVTGNGPGDRPARARAVVDSLAFG